MGLIRTRLDEVDQCPGEWYFWPTRHMTPKQLWRWLRRYDASYELKVYLNDKPKQQTMKVQVRRRA